MSSTDLICVVIFGLYGLGFIVGAILSLIYYDPGLPAGAELSGCLAVILWPIFGPIVAFIIIHDWAKKRKKRLIKNGHKLD